MKAIIGIVIFTLGAVSADIAGECDMASFYLELGCTPVPAADNGTCPESFTCPELHPDPTSCYYKGVAYADKATIAQNLVDNPCSQACSCSVYNNEPRFLCAAVDCFETFNSDMNQQCISTYELDSCCSTGSVCGKDAIAQLKTCEVDGKIYREGQMFEPANTQKTCICKADWDGNTNNATFCREINCGIEIHYQENILQNCAPVFIKNSRSCPIGFECRIGPEGPGIPGAPGTPLTPGEPGGPGGPSSPCCPGIPRTVAVGTNTPRPDDAVGKKPFQEICISLGGFSYFSSFY